MKKKVISVFLALVLCLTLLPTVALADTATSGNEFTLSFTGDCYTAHTQTVDLKDYLPKDAVVTGISSTLANIAQSFSREYTLGGSANAESARFSYTTRIYDEPASGSGTVTVSTSNYGNYVFTIHITLTGKYLVTLSVLPQNALYDGQPHRGYSDLKGTLTSGAAYTGDYVIAYAKQDGTPLDGAPSEAGDYTVTISIPEGNEGYKHKEPLVLHFSILTDAEVQYQTKANGKWHSGTFEQALADVYEGGTIRLLKDVVLTRTATASKKMTITSVNPGERCTITSNTDQHGYLLNVTGGVSLKNVIVDGGSKTGITANRAAISVNGGKLTLDNGAVVQNNENTIENGAGGGVCVISGELQIRGGIISGNQACWGGGAAVLTSAKAQMTSGSIVQNKSTSSKERGGGGVYLSYGDFDLNGGKIAENTAEKSGGGGVYILAGTFTVNDGQIVENYAATAGGAVYVNLNSNLHLVGGKICNNNAGNFAGGVECAPTSNIVIAGNPIVNGNTSGEETNGGIYPDGTHEYGGYYPNITVGALSDGAAVNFYTWLKRDGFLIASPVEAHTITTENLSRLSFEDVDFALTLDDSGNVVLTNVGVYQITFDANGGSIKTETAKTAGGKLASLPTPTRSGYTFAGWFTAAEGGERVTTDTVFATDGTVYAHWTRNSSSGNSSGGATQHPDSVTNDRFADVPANSYYDDAVRWAVENGVTDGVDESRFAPNRACTRAQIVTFLWRVAGCPVARAVNPFGDVSSADYFYEAVLWAVENGITEGTSATTFGPDKPCTRAQAVAFLLRFAADQGMDAVTMQELVSGFGDAAKVPGYALSAFNWALASGIVEGSNGYLLPNDTCTRAQIVTMLYRLLGK